MVKLKHPQPMQYRVQYVLNNSILPSTNYYSVFHSSETLVDLLYILNKKGIKGSDINILSVEEFCPYNDKWYDRTDKAIENSDPAIFTLSQSTVLLNGYAITNTAG